MWNLIAELFVVIRNARAWLVALTLLGALFWTLWETSAKRLDHQELSGELVEIIPSGKKSDPMFYIGKVRLADGVIAKITMSIRPPVPKVGSKIPVVFERYDDGKILYGFNNTQWIADGGMTN
jgi:hypothetical protein